LLAEIGRRVEQKPVGRIGGDCNLGLGSRTSLYCAVAQPATVRTSTIPLGKSAPGCGAEDSYAHFGTFTTDRVMRPKRLKFSVGVRANFAIEVDFFVLRGNPFHCRGSLADLKHDYFL